jgi:hypothetical protein
MYKENLNWFQDIYGWFHKKHPVFILRYYGFNKYFNFYRFNNSIYWTNMQYLFIKPI